jgi:hypothetical protein
MFWSIYSKELSIAGWSVVHTCNLINSGGRDQEDQGWKPAWANSSRDLSQKKNHKKELVE